MEGLYGDLVGLGLGGNALVLAVDLSLDPGSELYEKYERFGVRRCFSGFRDLYRLYSGVGGGRYRVLGFCYR